MEKLLLTIKAEATSLFLQGYLKKPGWMEDLEDITSQKAWINNNIYPARKKAL